MQLSTERNSDAAIGLIRDVDAICDEFEAALSGSEMPCLSQWVSRVSRQHRDRVLSELVGIALEHLARKGFPDPSQALLSANPSLKPEIEALLHSDLAATRSWKPPARPAAPRFATGNVLAGRYELREAVGEGAFGVVYRGTDRKTSSEVAIKVLERGASRRDSLLEAEIQSLLSHRNILRLDDYFIERDCPVLVLEFVAGGSLLDRLRHNKRMAHEDVLVFLRQAASALVHAHEQGVVHRDLKPANVLVDNRGDAVRYVIADFGVGRFDAGVQLRPETAGTYCYMAPEQIRGRATPQSDLWALGVIGYQLLTGQLPFTGTSARELRQKILLQDIPAFESLSADATPLAALIGRLLRRDLDQRLTAVELLEQLPQARGAELEPDFATSASGGSPAWSTHASRLNRRLQTARWAQGVALVLILLVWGVVHGLLSVLGLRQLAKVSASKQRAEENSGPETSRPRELNRQARTRWWRQASGLALCVLGVAGPWAEYEFSPLAIDSVLTGYQFLPGAGAAENEFFLIKASMVFDPIVAILIFIVYGSLKLYGMNVKRALDASAAMTFAGGGSLTDRLQSRINADPNDLSARLELSRQLLAEKRFQDAAVEARLVVESDPFHFEGNLALQSALAGLQREDLAKQVADRYLKTNPYAFEFLSVSKA